MNLLEAKEVAGFTIKELATRCFMPEHDVQLVLQNRPIDILKGCLIIDLIQTYYGLEITIKVGSPDLPKLEVTPKFKSSREEHGVSLEDLVRFSRCSMDEVRLFDEFSEGSCKTIVACVQIYGLLTDQYGKIEDFYPLLLTEAPDFSRLRKAEEGV